MDVLWHVLNFFALPLGMGFWAALLTKVIWRRDLQTVGWLPLVAWAVSACTGVALAGMVVLGQDGRMLTYGAMVVACAAALWWRGLRLS